MTEQEIISQNQGLIYDIANKYFYGVDKEDLFQAGALGAIKAYRNYKDDGNTKFSTYAYMAIYGEMYNLVNASKPIKVSKDILRLYKKIEQTRYALAQSYGRILSNQELADYLEIDLETIEMAMNAFASVQSLDKTEESDRSLYETIGTNEDMSLIDKLSVYDAVNNLSEEEKRLVYYRYFDDLTQSETARKLKMSQVKVSRYEKKALDKMRDYYDVV